jgi:hypothetical protein
MTQSHDMLAATVSCLAGLVFAIASGVVAIGALMLARGDHHRQTVAQPPARGVMATGFRFCTAEQQFQAAVIRTDGTALCLECGHHIPNREATDA